MKNSWKMERLMLPNMKKIAQARIIKLEFIHKVYLKLRHV